MRLVILFIFWYEISNFIYCFGMRLVILFIFSFGLRLVILFIFLV